MAYVARSHIEAIAKELKVGISRGRRLLWLFAFCVQNNRPPLEREFKL